MRRIMSACMNKKDKEFFLRALENYGGVLEEVQKKSKGRGGLSVMPIDVDDEIKKNNEMFEIVNNLPEC